MLANIVLDPIDKEWEARGHRFARYADDFIVLVKSAEAAQRVMVSLIRYCEGRLKLVVNRRLGNQGVPDMRAIWIALHYGPNARV